MQSLCFGHNELFRGNEVAMHPFYSGWPKIIFWSVLDHLAKLRHIKRCKTRVLGLNALFQDSKVVNHPFYNIEPKMKFRSVSEHFAILRHIKRYNSCGSGLNPLFRGTEVAMHPFYSGWPKIMFGSVLDHFANLGTKKDEKLMLWAWLYYFRVAKLRSIHSTTFDPNDVWECFGAFR
jgi:hypothetical protein